MEKSMQSISNFDCYQMVKENYESAQKRRMAERRRIRYRTAKAIEISIVLFSIFVVCQWLAGF